jgi:hypothetical protein
LTNPHTQKRRTRVQYIRHDYSPRKPDWRWVFLDSLAKTACVTLACMAAGVSRTTAYSHRSRFPKFRQKWDEAIEVGIELLEAHVRSRAFDPKDPASHVLAIFLLKSYKPEVYRENGHLMPPATTEALEAVDLTRLSDADLAALHGIASKLVAAEA